jgi:hypothetical protein
MKQGEIQQENVIVSEYFGSDKTLEISYLTLNVQSIINRFTSHGSEQ